MKGMHVNDDLYRNVPIFTPLFAGTIGAIFGAVGMLLFVALVVLQ